MTNTYQGSISWTWIMDHGNDTTESRMEQEYHSELDNLPTLAHTRLLGIGLPGEGPRGKTTREEESAGRKKES